MSSWLLEGSEKKMHDCLLQRFMHAAGLDPLSSVVAFSSRCLFFFFFFFRVVYFILFFFQYYQLLFIMVLKI